MKYRLIVLTHGEGETLDATLATFSEMVTPAPAYKTIFRDKGTLGFCQSVQHAWLEATQDRRMEYVFWLEHDFSFLRPVDLKQLAKVLNRNPMVAQMSLMRDAINEGEREAGGVYRFHTGTYMEHMEDLEWLEHEVCLTTNPSLMRREFMVRNPWPHYSSECEGKFSHDLRQRGYTFGTWDLGEVYVEHTGALRTGHGY